MAEAVPLYGVWDGAAMNGSIAQFLTQIHSLFPNTNIKFIQRKWEGILSINDREWFIELDKIALGDEKYINKLTERIKSKMELSDAVAKIKNIPLKIEMPKEPTEQQKRLSEILSESTEQWIDISSLLDKESSNPDDWGMIILVDQ